MGWYRKEKWQKNLSVYIVNYRFLSRLAHPLSPNRSNISESTKNISAYMEGRKVFFVFGRERFMFLIRWLLKRLSRFCLDFAINKYFTSDESSRWEYKFMQLSSDKVVIARMIYLNFIEISWGLGLSNWLIKTLKQDYWNFIKSDHEVYLAVFLKL